MALTHSPSIVTNGLVLCLDAGNRKSFPNNGGTAWTDLSGRGNTGTLNNGVGYNSGNGSVLTFAGDDDYVTSASLPSGTELFTLSIWIYFNTNILGSFGGTLYASSIFSGNLNGTMELFVLSNGLVVGPPYKIKFTVYGGGAIGTCEISNINMPLQTWHNIVLIKDGSASQKIYLNGSLLTTGNVSNSFVSGTLHVGGAPASGSFSAHLNGRIGNILRYNRALSATEIAQNYNALKGRYGLS